MRPGRWLILFLAMTAFGGDARAQQSFADWLAAFRVEAAAAGISSAEVGCKAVAVIQWLKLWWGTDTTCTITIITTTLQHKLLPHKLLLCITSSKVTVRKGSSRCISSIKGIDRRFSNIMRAPRRWWPNRCGMMPQQPSMGSQP